MGAFQRRLEDDVCKASIDAARTRRGQVGDRLELVRSSHGLPCFREVAGDPGCVICIKDGELLRMMVPKHIQEKLGVGPTVMAAFIETGHNMSDLIELEDRRRLYLSEFLGADGNPVTASFLGQEQPMADEGTGANGEYEIASRPELDPVA